MRTKAKFWVGQVVAVIGSERGNTPEWYGRVNWTFGDTVQVTFPDHKVKEYDKGALRSLTAREWGQADGRRTGSARARKRVSPHGE